MNSALVSYYFGNKSGLLLALLRKVLAPAMVQLQHLPDMPVPAPEKLRIHISGMVRTYFQYPYVNRLMHDLLSDDVEKFGAIIAEEFSQPVAEAQRRILQEGVESGVFRPVDPIMFYFHVIGACDQLFYGKYQLKHVFGVAEVSDELRHKFVDHLHQTIVEGILIR